MKSATFLEAFRLQSDAIRVQLHSGSKLTLKNARLNFSRSLLRSAKFLLQECAILCKAPANQLASSQLRKTRCATSLKGCAKTPLELQISRSTYRGYRLRS